MSARQRLVAGAIVQFGSFVVILGIPDGILGVLWPTMRHSLHRPLADLGELVLAGTVLYFAGGLVGDAIRRRIGLRWTLVAATIIGLGSLLGWAGAPAWWVILVALGCLGLVKGVLDSVLNAVAAVEGGVRRLGLLHASWAIGGTLGPVLVAILALSHGWRAAVGAIAVGAVVLVPFAFLSGDPSAEEQLAPEQNRQRAGSEQKSQQAEPGRALTDNHQGRLPLAGLVATTVAFFAYTAAEAGPVSWGATYLETYRHLSEPAAAGAMAVFWGALTLGRLSLALPKRFDPARVLEWSCVVFVAGTALLWLLPGDLAVIGLPIAGLGSATVFPLYMALTPTRLGEHLTGRAIGFSIAGAALGGPIAVAVFGVLASHFGTGVLGPCLFGATLLMYLTHRILAAVVARSPRPHVVARS